MAQIQFDELIESIRATEGFERLEPTLTSPAFEKLRGEFKSLPDQFDRHCALCAQIGATDNPNLRQLLMQFRKRLEAEMLVAATNEIQEAFTRSPEEGWKSFLTNVVSAVVSVSSLGHAMRLCKQPFPFDASRKDALAKLRKAIECMLQDRWDEPYEQMEWLAQQDYLPTRDRATLLSWIGQIDLLWFDKPARCRARLKMAETMVPDNVWVLVGWGSYFLRMGNSEKAKTYYERAIQLTQDNANGYVYMGDLVDADTGLNEQVRNKQAEHWYQEAISQARGNSLGYRRVLELLGRPQNLPTREEEFLTLVDTAIAVDPGAEYQTYIDAGNSYLANKRFSDARKWYDKAVSLHGDWPRAYVALAQWRRVQADDDAAREAADFCRKAIEVAPEAPIGYMSLAEIYVEKSDWAEASRIYSGLPGLTRPLGSVARSSVGKMQWKLGDCEKAESLLFKELRADGEESYASRFLEELATDYYQKQKNTEAAKRVYDEILTILGDAYRGSYYNWLGNMYYFSAQYELAVEQYQQAIAAAPNEAVYHRNLSLAYELLHDYDNACRALDGAFEIDKNEKTLAEKGRLKNLQGNEAFSKGDYEAAKAAFEAAVEFNSSEPVYYTNVAAAWKQVKERGQRGHALGEARRWYEKALKVAVEDKREYTAEINRLSRRIDVAQRYGEKALDYINLVTPIAVEVASDLVPLVEGKDSDDLSEELAKLVADTRTNIRTQLGLNTPGIRFRGNEGDLPAGNYIVTINEVPLVLGKVFVDSRFFSAPQEVLSRLDLTGESASDPLTGEKGVWIGEAGWSKLQGEDFKFQTPMQYMMRHVEALVRKNSSEFLGHQEVVNLLNESKGKDSKEINQSAETLAALATAGRALLAEEIPIQPFAELCGTVAKVSSQGRSLREAVEEVRALPAFRDHLPGKDPSLPRFKLTPRLEEHLGRTLYEQEGHLLFAMEPAHCQKVLAALNQTGDQSAALIVQRAPRSLVRKLVELQSPKLHVLSAQDVSGENLEETQIIDIDDEPPDKALHFGTSRRFSRRLIDANKDADLTASAASEVSINLFVSRGFEAQESVADDKPLRDLLAMMTEGLFWELGIILPEVRVQVDPNLDVAEFRLGLNGAEPVRFSGLGPDEFLVNESATRLKLLGIEGTEHQNPANENESAKVKNASEKAPACRSYGLTTWGPHGFLVLQLSAKIREIASQFQTDAITEYMLDLLEESFPDVVRPALKRYALGKLSAVLRELLSEEISIRDLRGILESLLAINGTTDVDFTHFIVFLANTDRLCPAMQGQSVSELTPGQLADFVRTSLHRYISHKYTRGRSSLIVYLLDADIERRLLETDTRPLTDEEKQKFFTAIRDKMSRRYSGAVILTGIEIRRALRRLLAVEFPRLAVLCYQELSPELNIQPLDRIAF